MFREAVILAGGFGTRLSHVVSNVPKPMAPVYGKPFLCYLLDRLDQAGVTHAVLATGYKHECIASYFGEQYKSIHISYSQETEPLFTGGAIRLAATSLSEESFLVVNGDTLFDIDLSSFCDFHEKHRAPVSIALRQVANTDRYGAVETDGDIITCFREKESSSGAGVINGGIYAIQREWLLSQELPKKFSFEKEVLQPLAPERILRGMVFRDYFIDIGVPDDYFRAQREFASLFAPDRFLFLDRDGVLNRHLPGDYVRSWAMWEWLPGAMSQLAAFARRFERIFIVSNQQGVGKGLFSPADLNDVHAHMLADIEATGGRIDRIYVCTDLKETNSPNRKPETGMAMQAKHDFPEVDFTQSVLIGDSTSDILFGYRCGMRCVYLTNKKPVPEEVRDYTDLIVQDMRSSL